MKTPPVPIAVFISGRGSNFSALLDAQRRGRLRRGRITLCVSDRPQAQGLETARQAGVETLVLPDPSDGNAILRDLHARNIGLIALAGYIRLVPPEVVQAYRGRILNIHPALLPAFGGKGFYGIRVHQAVLASGTKTTGATVHIVTEEYDQGPIVLQRKVPVKPGDTPESLQARVLRTEHRIYWRAINRVLRRLG